MGRMNRDNHNNFDRDNFTRDDNNFDRNFDAREYSREDNSNNGRDYDRRDNVGNYDRRDVPSRGGYGNNPNDRGDYRVADSPRGGYDNNNRPYDDYNAGARARAPQSRDNGYVDRDRDYDTSRKEPRGRYRDTLSSADYDRKAEDVERIQVLNRKGGGGDVTICAPKSYSDVQNLIITLRNNQSLIVDTDKIDPKDMQRYLDFLSGAIYALGGSHQKVGKSLMLFTPAGAYITIPCDFKGIDNYNDKK